MFQYRQCSSVFSAPVSSVFQYLQRRIKVDLINRFFSSRRKIAQQIFWEFFGCLQRSPERRESVDTTSRDTHLAGFCPAETPWPNTLEVYLRAQGRAVSAGAIQLASSQRIVALYDPMPAVPRGWLSGRGNLTSAQRDVALNPQGRLFFVSFTKLTWSPLSWSSQGVDFYKSFPSSEGRPRGLATSSTQATRSREGKRTAACTSSTSGGVRQPTLSGDVAAFQQGADTRDPSRPNIPEASHKTLARTVHQEPQGSLQASRPLPASSKIGYFSWVSWNLWSFQGVDIVMYKSFPSSKGRPRGTALSS